MGVGVAAYDGVPGPVLAERLGVRRLALLASVGSALDVAHDLAARDAPDATLVLADRQDAGRGRHGRFWVSPAGQGIWLALLRRHPEPAGGVLALRAGLALAGTLADLGADPRLKWPNDVLLAGGKVAGILCEARAVPGAEPWVAIGVGINVTGPVPAPGAAVLAETVPDVDRVQVLAGFVPALLRLDPGAPLAPGERTAWAARDWLEGRTLATPVPGRAAGIAPDGALLVETADGTRRILGGTVTCSSR